jgi:hypothetical protein
MSVESEYGMKRHFVTDGQLDLILCLHLTWM